MPIGNQLTMQPFGAVKLPEKVILISSAAAAVVPFVEKLPSVPVVNAAYPAWVVPTTLVLASVPSAPEAPADSAGALDVVTTCGTLRRLPMVTPVAVVGAIDISAAPLRSTASELKE